MDIQQIDATGFEDFDDHEEVLHCRDEDTGLRAYIAIHDRTLGPALGGCRMWPYPAEEHAIKDVLRLSRGMTYKSAITGLPLGGGKAVIVGNPRTDKTQALLERMGDFIESLAGRYITAEDSGTGPDDLAVIASRTRYVAGIGEKTLIDGTVVNGDPSPSTAYGVYIGLETAVRHRLGVDSLNGVRVAIQGVGNVGRHLARRLSKADAELVIADIVPDNITATLEQIDARVVDTGDILQQDVEVVAPCALGGVLTEDSIASLRAQVVAGAANNQLANEGAGTALFERGILYAPDYVINAGGIIDIFYERRGYDHARVLRQIERIGETLATVFDMSRRDRSPTHVAADRLARARLLRREVSCVA